MASKLLLLFVIVVTFSDALAIQCYQCDSSKNVACDFGILSFAQPVADCQASDGSLMGIVSSIIPQNCYKLSGITTDGKSYTARGCAVNTYVNTCDALAKTIQFANQEKIQSLECWTCNTDKCNSATALSGMTIAAVLAACFLFLF